MWDYKINHYSKDNERMIIRKNDNEIRYLSPEQIWTRKKERAKKFFHEEDAISAFISIRTKWEHLKNEIEFTEERMKKLKEKRTRAEL